MRRTMPPEVKFRKEGFGPLFCFAVLSPRAASYSGNGEVTEKMDEYYQAAAALPPPFAGALASLSPRIAPAVQEIRLRVGQSVQFTMQGKLTAARKYLPSLAGEISEETLKTCFLHLCRHSVYAYEDELSRGYFTLPGGSRVGVAGCRGGRGFGRVTSLNLRIARPILCSLPGELTDFLAVCWSLVRPAAEKQPSCARFCSISSSSVRSWQWRTSAAN